MPTPSSPSPALHPDPTKGEGLWTEVEGVAHCINSNGTMTVLGKAGPISLWVGEALPEVSRRWVDAKLRARGVYSLAPLDAPMLLVPSPAYVDVEQEAPAKPFDIHLDSIAGLAAKTSEPSSTHRVRIAGRVTYRDSHGVFVQDASGGVRVLPLARSAADLGDAVEVIGFPAASGEGQLLTDALLRTADGIPEIAAKDLNLGEAWVHEAERRIDPSQRTVGE